jgi:phage pi2 protein 07
MCVQEEERLKQQNGGYVSYVQHNTKKMTFGSKCYIAKNQHESGPSNAPKKS